MELIIVIIMILTMISAVYYYRFAKKRFVDSTVRFTATVMGVSLIAVLGVGASIVVLLYYQ